MTHQPETNDSLLRDFAKDFLAERQKAIDDGDLEQYVRIYEFLWDRIIGRKARRCISKAKYLENARRVGLQLIKKHRTRGRRR